MFTEHFHMTEQPFSERLPVERIFQDERMHQGLSRLSYFLHTGTIALLTGQTGVGKSSLLKLFLHALATNRYSPVYLHITNMRTSCLLKLIVAGLGEIPKNTKDRLFTQILDRAHKTEATTVLILDEAHLLSGDALTDLRLLISSALDETPPLKILLCGQELLRNQLKRASHIDLAQRVSVHYHLPSLTQTQTQAYLDAQMKSSGSNDKVFETNVKSLIHEYASGVPRQINNIATACLIQASSLNATKITQDIFAQAVRECQL